MRPVGSSITAVTWNFYSPLARGCPGTRLHNRAACTHRGKVLAPSFPPPLAWGSKHAAQARRALTHPQRKKQCLLLAATPLQ
jgi:hypothetical protein